MKEVVEYRWKYNELLMKIDLRMTRARVRCINN